MRLALIFFCWCFCAVFIIYKIFILATDNAAQSADLQKLGIAILVAFRYFVALESTNIKVSHSARSLSREAVRKFREVGVVVVVVVVIFCYYL